MKKLILLAALVVLSLTSGAQKFINGYVKKNGTYVQPHYKTQSNSTNWDNYSTKGNSNSFTGKKGYKAKDYSSDALKYGKNKSINTGSRGGQYYVNSKSRKTYVPKRYKY